MESLLPKAAPTDTRSAPIGRPVYWTSEIGESSHQMTMMVNCPVVEKLDRQMRLIHDDKYAVGDAALQRIFAMLGACRK